MRWRSHRERARISPAVLGAGVILALIVGFYLAASKDLPFSGGYRAHFQFQSANQIAPNAPVRIAGVNVGEVGEISSGPGDTASVTVEIRDEGLPLHTDATARIRPRTFLEGAFFVDIRPGSPSAPELPDGGVVPVGQTSTPVQLDQILSGLTPDVRDQLGAAVRALGAGFDGAGPKAVNATIPVLDPLFTEGSRVAEAFAGTEPHDLSRGISALSRVNAALARDRTRLGALVSSFSRVAAALADRQLELRESIDGLDRLVDEAPEALDTLSRATPAARRLVAALRPALRRAPRTINAAVPLSEQLRRLMRPRELPALIDLAEPAVGALAASAPVATEVFAGLRAPVNCVLTQALPTLKTPVDDGDLSTGEPTYRDLLYSLTGLASASRNFDGNGFNTRYYAGFNTEVLTSDLGNPLQALFAATENPILGSRPAKPAVAPPLRPDVPCTENEAPDLEADVTPPGEFVPLSAGGGP